jgi:hypothetical protein
VFPRAVHTPQTEVVAGRLPGWEFVREQAPGTATPNDIVDSVQDRANGMQSGSAGRLGWRQQRVEVSEFSIRQVGQIRLPQGQTPAIVPVKPVPSRFSGSF